MTVADPWSFVWWDPEITLEGEDPDNGRPLHPPSTIDWQVVVRSVTEAVQQCTDAVDPLEEARSVEFSSPICIEDWRLVTKWLHGGDKSVRLDWLSSTSPNPFVQNGRHRLWASRDHLSRPYPLRTDTAAYLKHALNSGHEQRSEFSEFLRLEVDWLVSDESGSLGAMNQSRVVALWNAIELLR